MGFTAGLGKGEKFLFEREGRVRSIPACAENCEWINQSPQDKSALVAYPSHSPLNLAQNLEALQQEVMWD